MALAPLSTGNCRAMTAVTARWLDTRQRRSNRAIFGEMEKVGDVCVGDGRKLELAAKEPSYSFQRWTCDGVDDDSQGRGLLYIGDGLTVCCSSSLQFARCDLK
jgi:hypothetical protein